MSALKIRTPMQRVHGLIIVGSIFFLALSSIGFTLRYMTFEERDRKLQVMERSLQDLRAALNVDSVRQYNIQKIMGIIENFNPDLPSSSRYEIADEVYSMSVKYTNLGVDLLCATITHESAATWDPEITSHAGAMGLMQVMPATGMFVAEYEGLNWTTPEEILYDPIYNVRIGSRYLSALVSLYGLEGGLAAYNGGEKRAARWLNSNKKEGILAAETEKYVPAVLKLYGEYQEMVM